LADRPVLQSALVSDCGSELRLAVSDTPCFNATNAVSDRAGVAKSVRGMGRGWIYTADCPGTEKSHPPPPSKEGLKINEASSRRFGNGVRRLSWC